MNNNPTLYERAEKRGQASLGVDGQPIGCIVRVYGDTFRPKYCGLPGSKLRCKDCWERKYRKAKKEQSSFTPEEIAEPFLIAGRYTLAELTVPNRKRERA
jgi:hypothetical protein